MSEGERERAGKCLSVVSMHTYLLGVNDHSKDVSRIFSGESV